MSTESLETREKSTLDRENRVEEIVDHQNDSQAEARSVTNLSTNQRWMSSGGLDRNWGGNTSHHSIRNDYTGWWAGRKLINNSAASSRNSNKDKANDCADMYIR